MRMQVNLLLGLDVVSPAAIRTDVQLGAEKHDLGVMVWAVEGLRTLPSLPTRVSLQTAHPSLENLNRVGLENGRDWIDVEEGRQLASLRARASCASN
jgi:hypothetical protein